MPSFPTVGTRDLPPRWLGPPREVGFGRLGFTEICSWTLPTNLVSQRIMEKLGFRYERDFEFAGLGHRFYRLMTRGRAD